MDQNYTVEIPNVQSRIIASAEIKDNMLVLIMDDGCRIEIEDEPQCCEMRYMHTDDNIDQMAGETLVEIRVQSVGYESDDEDDNGNYHEMGFMHVVTNLMTYTLETHNLHNGYYGGFWVYATAYPPL